MIKEDYVSFEVAKLLEEKGYEGDFDGYYNNAGYEISRPNPNLKNYHYYKRPSLYCAMKWLLETHNIFITILQTEHTTVTMEQEYFFYRVQKSRKRAGVFTDTFMNPEQACEAAIKYCLENFI